jgi:hypothetical protein
MPKEFIPSLQEEILATTPTHTVGFVNRIENVRRTFHCDTFGSLNVYFRELFVMLNAPLLQSSKVERKKILKNVLSLQVFLS